MKVKYWMLRITRIRSLIEVDNPSHLDIRALNIMKIYPAPQATWMKQDCRGHKFKDEGIETAENGKDIYFDPKLSITTLKIGDEPQGWDQR